MENDNEHYEIIDQMNSSEIFIHSSSNSYYNTKNEYKELVQPSSYQGFSYPTFQRKKWSEMGDSWGNFGFATWGGVVLSKYGHGIV